MSDTHLTILSSYHIKPSPECTHKSDTGKLPEILAKFLNDKSAKSTLFLSPIEYGIGYNRKTGKVDIFTDKTSPIIIYPDCDNILSIHTHNYSFTQLPTGDGPYLTSLISSLPSPDDLKICIETACDYFMKSSHFEPVSDHILSYHSPTKACFLTYSPTQQFIKLIVDKSKESNISILSVIETIVDAIYDLIIECAQIYIDKVENGTAKDNDSDLILQTFFQKVNTEYGIPMFRYHVSIFLYAYLDTN